MKTITILAVTALGLSCTITALAAEAAPMSAPSLAPQPATASPSEIKPLSSYTGYKERPGGGKASSQASFYGSAGSPAKSTGHDDTGVEESYAKVDGKGRTLPKEAKRKNDGERLPLDAEDDETEEKLSKKSEELALPSAEADGTGDQLILPEITMKAIMSASDVNRVVCSSEMKDAVWSKEKGIIVERRGRNAFVKFEVAKEGSKLIYAKNPAEIYFPCGDNVYKVIVIPKRVPAQTLRLDTGISEKIRKNSELHRSQSFVKTLRSLIKSAYTEDLPDSYTIEILNDDIKVFRDVKTVLHRTITVDGEGLILKEFHVSPREIVERISFTEKDFARKEFTKNIRAMGADKLTVKKGEVSRLFIVESKESGNVERP